MISLSPLIVEPDNSLAVPTIKEPVLETMRATGTGLGTFHMTISTIEPSGSTCFDRSINSAYLSSFMPSLGPLSRMTTDRRKHDMPITSR
jgi:hypothetical protein